MINEKYLLIEEEFEVINHKTFNSNNIGQINFGENERHKFKVIEFCESFYLSNDLIMTDLS